MTKEEKIKEAERLGDECGRRGFTSTQLEPQLRSMSKEERAAFDRALIAAMRDKQEQSK